MSIYAQPTKVLMTEWARENLSHGQAFDKSAPLQWFQQRYPKIKQNTVGMHVEGMSVNNRVRKHHPSIKAGSGYDLFFKLGPNHYRLWDPAHDPQPIYKSDIEAESSQESAGDVSADSAEDNDSSGLREFAFERDLRNYLVRSLGRIEPGLRLYEEEGITGVEFPVGGRFIDILAIDKDGAYVVVELKVSRGYDRVIGQLLRYVGWVEQNMEPTLPVRGIIVASEITTDLRLACSRLTHVRLIEYEIDFRLRTV